jgi:hypothetical protein
MCGHGQGTAVVAHEDAVTALLVPPINLVLPRDRLKISDLPVQRVASHSCEEFGRGVHERDTTRETAAALHGGAFALPNAELTGRRRLDALPARRRICAQRLAGKVASRWRSG